MPVVTPPCVIIVLCHVLIVIQYIHIKIRIRKRLTIQYSLSLQISLHLHLNPFRQYLSMLRNLIVFLDYTFCPSVSATIARSLHPFESIKKCLRFEPATQVFLRWKCFRRSTKVCLSMICTRRACFSVPNFHATRKWICTPDIPSEIATTDTA